MSSSSNARPAGTAAQWSTKELVTLALLAAISLVFSFVEFPLIPGIAWLKYDPSLVPALVAAFAFSPIGGFVVGCASAILHGLIMGDPVGTLMNLLVYASMILPSAAIYQRSKSFKSALIGLGISVVIATAVAIVSNLIIDPFYFGMPYEAVVALVAPALLPFNLIKGIVNSILTLIVYKSISNLIKPKKDQVKGR